MPSLGGKGHTAFTPVFVVAASCHLHVNWKIQPSYLRNRIRAGAPRTRGLAWSGIAAAALLAFTFADLRPVGSIMEVSETLSASWSTSATEPPVPHAEFLTLAKLSETVKLRGRRRRQRQSPRDRARQAADRGRAADVGAHEASKTA